MTRSITRSLSLLLLWLAGVAGCSRAADEASIAGAWQELDPTGRTVLGRWDFQAEGTFTFDSWPTGAGNEGGDHRSGTYLLEGTSLVLCGLSVGDGQRQRTRTLFYTRGDRLALEVYYPRQGSEHTGPVGSWAYESRTEALDLHGGPLSARQVSAVLDIQPDGKARQVRVEDGGAPVSTEGSYVALGPGSYRLTFLLSAGVTTSTRISLVDDAVLATEVLQRPPAGHD